MMTTIANAVLADPASLMVNYIGWEFSTPNSSYKIEGITFIPLRDVTIGGLPLTEVYHRKFNLDLIHLDLPVFVCSGRNTNAVFTTMGRMGGPHFHLSRGAALLPPELCCLSTKRILFP
jgi:hypothetical protein